MSDQRRQVFALGGRISDTIARHLTFHLAQSREGVEHISRDVESWPGHLLRMRPGDVVFLVDFRRYEPALERLARAISTKRVKIVLLTDSWNSPIKGNAAEVLAVPIETGTVWDSYAAPLAIVEAIVARIAEQTWEATRERIPHHLIDIRDPLEPYSAADFCTDVVPLVTEITERGNLPVIAGGTMLYLKALKEGMADLPAADPAIRQAIIDEAQERGWQAMHDELRSVDPGAAAADETPCFAVALVKLLR